MTAPTISDYLKYANLQMAAEAFLVRDNGTVRDDIVDALKAGNLHASVFTQTQADAFADPVKGWTVLDQRANTPTGFSGTLFKNNQTGELVLSFRSTEFIDDAVRDNQTTNKPEIHDRGWAFGQIADMEQWYADLLGRTDSSGQPILAGKNFTVTGYSLGGHLATAFNLLRKEDAARIGSANPIAATYTFNGAGVGNVTGSVYLSDLIATFDAQRKNADGNQIVFGDSNLQAFYLSVRDRLNAGERPTDADFAGLESTVAAAPPQKVLLRQAMANIGPILDEVNRLKTLSETTGKKPRQIAAGQIDGVRLDYQIAMLTAAQSTSSYRTSPPAGAWDAYFGRNPANPLMPNFFDVYGATPFSGVANSQWHYGAPTPVYIEDQPLYRGNVLWDTAAQSSVYADVKLLVPGYDKNDFGDTHSLVLIVDSLNVQNTLLQLVPEAQRSAAAKTLDTILRSASWRKAESTYGTQGQAEGDVLENVVNALADLCLGPQAPAARLNGSPEGNTWWSTTNLASGSYTGRDAFYAKLKAITDSATYKALQGKVEIVATSTAGGASARDDFGRLLALNDLAPFALKLTDTTALAALKSANETLAQSWEADAALTAAQRASGLANFSNDWLADRANFLDRKNWFNARNKNPVDPTVTPSMLNHRFQNPSITFKDVDSGYEIAQGVITDATKRMYFGAAENDALSGGRDADHLYGAGGADTLTGGAGRDRLEGGADDDRLEGGKDNDILLGGAGNDSYVFTSGDGWDWIDDRDGQGTLRYDGKLLGSAAAPIQKIAANTWQSHNGQITYSLYDWNEQAENFPVLSISGGNSSGGGLWIKRWQPGQFGITLPGALAPAPALPPGPTTPVTKTTDWYDHDHAVLYGGLPAVELIALGDYGEVWGSGRLLGNASDNYLHNGEGDDELSGFGGKDTLIATGGNDKLYGGDGNDALQAGDGNDLLEGDEGSDVLAGGRGQDVLDGGAGDDFLMGGSSYTALRYDWSVERLAGQARFNQFGGVADLAGDGSDLLRGGAGNDWLWDGEGDDLLDGGEDSDQLVGSAGADKLLGGAGDDQLSGDGAQSSSPAYYTLPEYHGNDYLDGGAGSDILSGDGGSDQITLAFAGDIGYELDASNVEGDGAGPLRFGAGTALAGITARLAKADHLLLTVGADRLLAQPGLAGAHGGSGSNAERGRAAA